MLTPAGSAGAGQRIEIPVGWTDMLVYLHVENPGTAYTLLVNDRFVDEVDDILTPADFLITPYLRSGSNTILLEPRDSRHPELQRGFIPVPALPFDNSYIFCQDKRSVLDFSVQLVPDSTRRFGVLQLDVVMQNGYNYAEPITIGYDLYDPNGKLLNYSLEEVVVEGRSTDTVRFRPFVYHTYENCWGVEGKAPLYRLMLYTKRDGVLREYIPVKLGFTHPGIEGNDLTLFGEKIEVHEATYNATQDEQTTRRQLLTLKKSGVNTLFPDYPQPYWFYDLCDQLGMMVVDQANINAPDRRNDRRTGGSPTNDPALLDQYLDRIRSMYFRSRNHTCIIGFALGSESGNGYNMYKAYEWIKRAEPERFVYYLDAGGEWNSDL